MVGSIRAFPGPKRFRYASTYVSSGPFVESDSLQISLEVFTEKRTSGDLDGLCRRNSGTCSGKLCLGLPVNVPLLPWRAACLLHSLGSKVRRRHGYVEARLASCSRNRMGPCDWLAWLALSRACKLSRARAASPGVNAGRFALSGAPDLNHRKTVREIDKLHYSPGAIPSHFPFRVRLAHCLVTRINSVPEGSWTY